MTDRGRKPALPEHLRHEIANAYAAGRSTVSLGREYGINPKTVTAYAIEYGVPIRDRSGRPRVEQPKVDDTAYPGSWLRDGLVWRPTVRRVAE